MAQFYGCLTNLWMKLLRFYIYLITSVEDAYQEISLKQKFKEIQTSLERHGIVFKYNFESSIHDRVIDTNTGWHIILGRGLDIYQKPESKYELSAVDQAKLECRATEIVYIKDET